MPVYQSYPGEKIIVESLCRIVRIIVELVGYSIPVAIRTCIIDNGQFAGVDGLNRVGCYVEDCIVEIVVAAALGADDVFDSQQEKLPTWFAKQYGMLAQ